MTCPDVRAALPLALTGDLPSDAAATLAKHLDTCPDCRSAAEALRAVRAALDAAPPPEPVAVDLPRLFRVAAAQQERRLRRWRWAAGAVGAVAAALALIVGLRLEVQFGPRQLVVRWGGGPPPVV